MTGLVALSRILRISETIAPVRWGATFPLLVFMLCQLTRSALTLQNQKLPVSILKKKLYTGKCTPDSSCFGYVWKRCLVLLSTRERICLSDQLQRWRAVYSSATAWVHSKVLTLIAAEQWVVVPHIWGTQANDYPPNAAARDVQLLSLQWNVGCRGLSEW